MTWNPFGGDTAEDRDALGPDLAGMRWVRRRLASGVAVVTTVAEGAYRGATLTGYTIVSIEPPLLLISLERDNQMVEWVQRSGSFALSLLTWQQQFLADRFAGFAPLAPGDFSGIPYHTAVSGAPILSQSLAWMDCTLQQVLETGDHLALIGAIQALGAGSGSEDDPLIRYLNRYFQIQ